MREVQDILMQRDDFLVYTHVSPDGDALGSAFALKYALELLGKRAQVVLGGPIPDAYSFMGSDYLVGVQPAGGQTVVALDCGDRARVAGLDADAPVHVGIDHHRSRKDFAQVAFVKDDAAATAEILFELFEQMGLTLSRAVAEALYIGIVTDTGGFCYSNTTAKTHRCAAALLEAGIDAYAINLLIFENKSLSSLKARALCVERLELFAGGRVVMSCLSLQDRAENSLSEQDMDGLSSIPRSVKGAVAGILLWQRDDGCVQAGLRSSGEFDVGALAQTFGGGGHKNASGFTSPLALQEVKERLLAEIEALL